ncbi:K(+)-transporting ATPase subunit C [Clostridium algidicarnis]|uniref:K(+)-transporting ATPase subunit C n=1 Tax=Clostridium algidicarnis TaxID=37659 RepID=UPI001CF49978|nr:K(+)-transporting ATPase subunit C [Clostridium algidicarnis]MCB2286912.1 K(+)-transporting ATPase subunit C [Clostridium algidicarnis]
MKILKQSLIISIVMLILCGLIFPLFMTGVSQIVFNKKANGSIIEVNGKNIGSEFIGQSFTDERFFKGRVSGINYNTYSIEDTIPNKDGEIGYLGVASGSQNLGPSSEILKDRVKKDMDEFLMDNPTVKKENIPTDLLTSSGSGLDPNISIKSARIQVDSISKSTGISKDDLNEIIDKSVQGKSLGVFGEKRVNVLKLNLEVAEKLGLI